jgi:putative ABC transport system permease protein
VARALAGSPSILLADEPTGNLDSKNGEAVMHLLTDLHREGSTICMVTHDPRFAKHAQREVHLFDGKVVSEQELKKLEEEVEAWVPLSPTHDELTIGAANWCCGMVGRLKPGVTAAQAQQDAGRVAQEVMRNYPAFMTSLHISAMVRPLADDTVSQARPLIRTLFLAVVVVLFIACANLAGLLLVRVLGRRREVAVRLALGASGAAVVRQMLLETLALSISGGCSAWRWRQLRCVWESAFCLKALPRIRSIGLDWQVVGFALFAAVLTGMLCGLIPAFAAARTTMNEALKEGGRTGTVGGGHARLRSALVVAETAVALILLTASGLLLRSYEKLRAVDLGFRIDHMLTATYGLPQRQYSTQASIDVFNDRLLEKLRQLPGVESVGITSILPATGNNGNSAFVAEGFVPAKGSPLSLAWFSQLLGDYSHAAGIPLLRGRDFTSADNARSPLVVIVNRTLADHFWPGQDPIGKRLRMGMQETPTPWLTVVGEVVDVKQNTPDTATSYQIYQPASQNIASYGSLAPPDSLNAQGGSIVLRTVRDPEQAMDSLRAVVRAIDPQLPLTQVQSMEHAVSETEAPSALQYGAYLQLCRGGGAAGFAGHLQRDCLLRGHAHARDGDPSRAGQPALEHHSSHSRFRRKAGTGRLRPRRSWRLFCHASFAFAALPGRSAGPGRDRAGRVFHPWAGSGRIVLSRAADSVCRSHAGAAC